MSWIELLSEPDTYVSLVALSATGPRGSAVPAGPPLQCHRLQAAPDDCERAKEAGDTGYQRAEVKVEEDRDH